MKVRKEIAVLYSDISVAEILAHCSGDLANYVITVTNDPYDDTSFDMCLHYERDETPEETAHRIKREKDVEKLYEQRRRQEYERLKKEFG